MKMLRLFLLAFLISSVCIAKNATHKKSKASKKEIQVIHSKYLRFCEQRAQEGRSLKMARDICRCSLKAILENGSLEDLRMLSKKSPKSLEFDTAQQKKTSNKLLALSNLEVHSLDGCEKSVQKGKTTRN